MPDHHASIECTMPGSGISSSGRLHWKSSVELEYAIQHIFLPADSDGRIVACSSGSEALACAVGTAAQTHLEMVDDTFAPRWRRIIRMLDNLRAFLRPGECTFDLVYAQLHGMEIGDTLFYLNRGQQIAVSFTKQDHSILYESFDTHQDMPSENSCLQCALQITDDVFHDHNFQSELANLLLHLDEPHGYMYTSHQSFFIFPRLLTSILRGVGHSTENPHATRSIRSHYNVKLESLDRSLLWLLIKVGVQTSLNQEHKGFVSYKVFVLDFMCNLAMDAIDFHLSSNVLHAISCKILRRLRKLGPSAPQWLHEIVVKTSVAVRETLEARWKEVQCGQSLTLLWTPSELDLRGDTSLSLKGSQEYIRNRLQIHGPQSPEFPISTPCIPRGSLDDILSLNLSFFERAHHIDPYVALYDVEQAVECEIDDWAPCVPDVDHACLQVVALMAAYIKGAGETYRVDPEHGSIAHLTVFELWIALDRWNVEVVPMLAKLSPEVPKERLHHLFFRKTTKLHRLWRADQYLSIRHSRTLQHRSQILSEHIFDVYHYANDSLYISGSTDFMAYVAECEKALPLHEIIACFKIRCPLSLHLWRFGTTLLTGTAWLSKDHELYTALLRSCIVKQWESPAADGVYIICFTSRGLAQQKPQVSMDFAGLTARDFRYDFGSHATLDSYIESTDHTSNDVLAAQMQCPDGLPLHEFVAFGHLRSGAVLQWANILRELRSRTLNFHSQDVFMLLAETVSQVGPLDGGVAYWAWHQELEELSFYSAILEEIEALFVDVAVRAQDEIVMGTISLLLTRLLASSPSEDVTGRVIEILRRIRRKTFQWSRELAYDVMLAPTHTKRKEVLINMAFTCRSTFDVEPAMVHSLVSSAEDVAALIFGAIVIRVNRPIDGAFESELASLVALLKRDQVAALWGSSISKYSQILLERDRRLSLSLESILRDAIGADISNQGIDSAVCSVWPGYRPGPQVWQTSPHPDTHWLVSETSATQGGGSQIVHLNLLDGTLLVDGKPIDGLPDEIRSDLTYKRIFGDQRFLVVPSNLPGMDFCILPLICEHAVHFVLRDGDLVIRARHRDHSDVLEVIPQERLLGDLPTKFIDGHVHWLNLSTSIIDIRPLENPWQDSPQNWKIDCTSGKYRMHKGAEWLVDIRSPTYDMVSNRMGCLDIRKNLIITLDAQQSRLSVILPRYSLSFFLNADEELESNDFKNMVYDECQCIGTLFGLENRLVLRPNMHSEGLVYRCAIIPHGKVSREKRSHHARITIDVVSTEGIVDLRPITYHIYHVDTDLACLSCDGSWKSRLYLANLHLLTSIDWIPDPLTSKTGIQQSQYLLQSAACQSIMDLDLDYEGLQILPDPWHCTIYPQVRFAFDEINYQIRRRRFLCGTLLGNMIKRPTLDDRRALHTAYLFPAQVNQVSLLPIHVYPSRPSELEHFASIISLAVYHWLLGGTEERRSTEPWNTSGSASTSRIDFYSYLRLGPWECSSQYMSMSTRALGPQSLAEMEALLQDAKKISQRFRLLFLLPAVVYFECNQPEKSFPSILVALSKRVPLRSLPRYDQHPSKLIQDLTCRLMKLHALHVPTSPLQAPDLPAKSHHPRDHQRITLQQLLHDRSPPLLPDLTQFPRDDIMDSKSSSGSSSDCSDALKKIFASFRMNEMTRFESKYITGILDSARHARKAPCIPSTNRAVDRPSIVESLWKYYSQCRKDYAFALNKLKKDLGPLGDPLKELIHRSGQWPYVTPDILLQCISTTSQVRISVGWKKCLVSLALLLMQLQRSRRLLHSAIVLDWPEEDPDFLRELENNVACDSWDPEVYPDWLLIQIQGNFLVRRNQVDVAMNVISSKRNATLQVNMGEGKTSVILPTAAMTLADGKQLVRVLVSKPSVVQVFRLLVNRLGGLPSRRIYHLSFPRFLTNTYGKAHIEALDELLSDCMRDRGILVIQPEHALSLKLSIVERKLPTDLVSEIRDFGGNPRSDLLELHQWVDSHPLDILDESDHILNPGFQLIHMIGHENHAQGFPENRWAIIQQVLRLARKNALTLSYDLPDAIEYEQNTSGSFPRIRILRSSDACQYLILLLVDDVMNGCLANIVFQDIDPQLQAAIRDFISCKIVSHEKADLVKEYGQRTCLWDGLLLLRGILACGVLLFALAERRWRVDYGLSPHRRTKLAVPYRAKDVPAESADFEHPDVTILLTCLSYYYGGLSEEQLRVSFEILQKEDNPSAEYANWLRDYEPGSVPEPIQNLGNVNTKSSELWNKHVVPLFARNQGAVDLYLSRVVFPREVQEFPWKLTASSWDLAEIRDHPTIGFSGTSDSKYLFPTSISQFDLDHQRGSDARVLSHLLKPENDSYLRISHPNGERQTALELLEMLIRKEPNVHVFLDVGAQILEFSNLQLAKVWLDLTDSSNYDGAVYFNEADEPMVITRDGICRSLASSPLAHRLDRCLVYLDDAHTRGTDLKLPHGSRAAVTLGPKVTKDRLVQGCMRMRKLGHGHSVMFLAPLEVDRSIRSISGKEHENIAITITDVLQWAIHETWTDIRQRASSWAHQGIVHSSQYNAWSRFCSGTLTREQLSDAWLQPERKSLVDLYAPFQKKRATSFSSTLNNHPDIQQRCEDLEVLQLPDAPTVDEEQEREIIREIEREREVWRTWLSETKPANHVIHPAVIDFVRRGVMPTWQWFSGRAFVPIMTALEGSSAASTNAQVWNPRVLATSDFCKTILPKSHEGGNMDLYLRPVQWVLSGKWNHDQVLVLLSPMEAAGLMPDIRVSKHVHLHVYTPRTCNHMRPADDLMFYSIPPLPQNWTPPWELIDQLNLFAGQLYIRDFGSYLRLCRFLGTDSQNAQRNVTTAVQRHGRLPDIGNTSSKSPLPCVTALYAIRRRGLPFAETHMGRILRGEQLTERDFKIMGRPWAESDTELATRHAETLAPSLFPWSRFFRRKS